jgi:tetratricopeptide (TPR) repeat protein
MLKPIVLSRWTILLAALILSVGVVQAYAQAETEEEKQERLYREDYERVTKIVAITDVVKRAEHLATFLKERPSSKMAEYAEANYFAVLDTLGKQGNNPALMSLSERLISLQPKLGETYYFYALALKNNSKFNEAMDALAKCYVLKNRLSPRARDALELMYKARNSRLDSVGINAGVQKLIKQAEAEVSK